MKIRFWGTRGSIAKPGLETLRYGGNTPCVEVRTSAETLVVIDCGTGIQALGQALLKNGPKPVRGSILISHTHWDHIQGFPFFAPLFAPGNEWDIYGPRGLGQSLRDALAGQMQYTYFPITLDALGSTVRFHDLVEGVFELEDVVVRTQYLNHPALTLGYRLEADGVAVVHASDHEPFVRESASGKKGFGVQDRRHVEFLRGADLVIHDAQYTLAEYPNRIGWGHSTVEYAVAACQQADAARLALTHHDPLRSDAELEMLEKDARSRIADAEPKLDVFAAIEGMNLDLAASSKEAPRPETAGFPAAAQLSPAIWEHSVLICASDEDIVARLSDAADSEGMGVLVAESAERAVDMLRKSSPSLVLFDEKLARNSDVLAAFDALAENGNQDFPVVVTAENELEGLEHVTDWLIEPYSSQYLRTRMRAWALKNECRWVRARPAPDEERRLAALRELNILDTAREERFDRITRLASSLFDVPVSLVSLVDSDRQWFKSCHGYAKKGSTRDTSFCSHAILDSKVMVVSDTLLDDRFADHPSVVGDPRIRFYAGYPLSLRGEFRIGTLCILDTKPREFDETAVALLQDLGKLVERELVL